MNLYYAELVLYTGYFMLGVPVCVMSSAGKPKRIMNMSMKLIGLTALTLPVFSHHSSEDKKLNTTLQEKYLSQLTDRELKFFPAYWKKLVA